MSEAERVSRVAVVIVNYRGADMVIAGLAALVAELAQFERGVAVIVDNASPGDDADRIERFLADFPGRETVRLVRSPVNGGFSYGNNVGFRAIEALDWQPDAIMLLNPDTTLRPGAIRALAATMETRPRAGVVGAQLEDEEGTPTGSAFCFPSMMGEFSRMLGLWLVQKHWPVLAETAAEPTRADWVMGAAMLIRTAALRDVGEMDEGYFLYFEEVDFMRRLKELGWEVWHCPKARVVHEAGVSTGVVGEMARVGRMPEYWFRSWQRYFVKNHGPVYARATALMRLSGTILGIAVAYVRGRRRHFPERYISDFARICLFGPIPNRDDRCVAGHDRV